MTAITRKQVIEHYLHLKGDKTFEDVVTALIIEEAGNENVYMLSQDMRTLKSHFKMRWNKSNRTKEIFFKKMKNGCQKSYL